MKKLFEKNDLLVIIAVSLACVFLLIPHFVKSEQLVAEISVNGEIVETVELDKVNGVRDMKLDCSPEITLRIEKGRICVKDAQCKDKLCQKCGWLDSSGDAAVCLPAKAVIGVKGGSKKSNEGSADVITY